MLANWITLSRFPVLLISVLILYFGSARAAGRRVPVSLRGDRRYRYFFAGGAFGFQIS
jgi:hypothetical protein